MAGLKLTYDIPSADDDFTRAGEASGSVKKKLRQIGYNPDAIRKVSIAMYEGEINVAIHAGGGEAEVEISSDAVTIKLIDHGPGIADVEKAMQVARDAIIDSPYSIPGKVTPGGMDYAPLYFMAYEQSSLLLATTVYFEPTIPSEVLISDINLRVSKAFRKHGIEVPYPYINVISKQSFVENGQSHGDRSHGSTRARGTGTVAAHEPARSLVA